MAVNWNEFDNATQQSKFETLFQTYHSMGRNWELIADYNRMYDKVKLVADHTYAISSILEFEYIRLNRLSTRLTLKPTVTDKERKLIQAASTAHNIPVLNI